MNAHLWALGEGDVMLSESYRSDLADGLGVCGLYGGVLSRVRSASSSASSGWVYARFSGPADWPRMPLDVA